MATHIRVADIVYYGLDSFGRERARWRVTQHMKRVEDDFDPNFKPANLREQLCWDIQCRLLLREKLAREERGLPCHTRYCYVYCTQEEATHLALTGVCGRIAPVEECEFIREVDWPAERIEEERQRAIKFIEHSRRNLWREWMWE